MASISSCSRIAGRGPLLRSLRMLLRRVERFAVHWARCREDQDWAGKLADRLEGALTEVVSAPGGGASAVIAGRRAQVSRKGFRAPSLTDEGPHGREVVRG